MDHLPSNDDPSFFLTIRSSSSHSNNLNKKNERFKLQLNGKMNNRRMKYAGHRSSSGVESDADSENLPPIPVQGNDSLGSPYENVRPGDDLSPAEGTSPTQWQFYHKPRDDDRRVSGTSVMSLWVSCRPFPPFNTASWLSPLLSMYVPFFFLSSFRHVKFRYCAIQAARNINEIR